MILRSMSIASFTVSSFTTLSSELRPNQSKLRWISSNLATQHRDSLATAEEETMQHKRAPSTRQARMAVHRGGQTEHLLEARKLLGLHVAPELLLDIPVTDAGVGAVVEVV